MTTYRRNPRREHYPPATTAIGSGGYPASDLVSITTYRGQHHKAQAVFEDDGQIDCWRTSDGEIFWDYEVKEWNP